MPRLNDITPDDVKVVESGPINGTILRLENGVVALRLSSPASSAPPWYFGTLDGWVSVTGKVREALEAAIPSETVQ